MLCVLLALRLYVKIFYNQCVAPAWGSSTFEGVRVLKLIRFVGLLAFPLVVAACGGSPDAQNNVVQSPTVAPAAQSEAVSQVVSPTITVPATALATGSNGDLIVARVNDSEITLADYQRSLGRFPQSGDAADLGTMVLETMIEQTLIEQAAAERGITISDAEIDTELQSYIQQVGGQEAWQTWLTENQYTEAEFRESLRESFITNRVRDAVTEELNTEVPHVHARHILVATQEQANTVLTSLQNGEDFAALAAQYSEDSTTKDNGGDLGWFIPEELTEPSLARIIFALEPGSIAGPVRTSLGYHIVQTLERADRIVPEERRIELGQARFENWLASLKAAATITRYL
jgi:parvulin-like peptidyl-prolyl isomerase